MNKDFVHCDKCPPHFGWCKKNTNQLAEHIETFHKNGQILTEADFMKKTY